MYCCDCMGDVELKAAFSDDVRNLDICTDSASGIVLSRLVCISLVGINIF